jgi:hypothetical protein
LREAADVSRSDERALFSLPSHSHPHAHLEVGATCLSLTSRALAFVPHTTSWGPLEVRENAYKRLVSEAPAMLKALKEAEHVKVK